jgi:hypothetical protein
VLGYLLGGLLATVLTVYTALAAASCIGGVDRWLRTRLVGRWPLRSLLPYWGLFAQQTGIFDLDIWCRVVGAEDAEKDAEEGAWQRMTHGERGRLSPVWRPWQRADQAAQVLTLRLLQAGGLHGDPRVAESRPYLRIVDRVRDELSATGVSCRAPLASDRVQFAVWLSRGHWTQLAPSTVFTSRLEPRVVRDAEERAR